MNFFTVSCKKGKELGPPCVKKHQKRLSQKIKTLKKTRYLFKNNLFLLI